ncbi:ergothioneine biosynthesis glutamate--cysteine ligase EgtA [Actinophytocola sp.]|uniref:ergothioneine biosynthesis glutamate--cysteine ligase EgtA n=1 Tax=Actinophytocola sp. TaxID=1872138 RepID=UPI003D6AC13B
MTALPQIPGNSQVIEPFRQRLSDRVEAEAYVASVCFKHGPPRLTGVELEWIVHHEDDPRRPLDADRLTAALGPYAPRTLNKDSPQLPLPAGSPLTLEPGGQVEISALPQPTLTELFGAVTADLTFLSELLASAGLVLGDTATDQHRTPRRLLDTPRYAAMEQVFEPIGPHGITMMCATAGLQVCVDAGESDTLPARWAAVHALGPVLVAAFANSPTLEGRATGWASARMRAVLGTDPPRSSPSAIVADPVADWARRVLDTPVLCVRGDSDRPGDRWATPEGMSFADWLAGARPDKPTTDDLDYHISTMFPPVRPHGYLEVRYLDAQRGDGWVIPVALLAALLSTPRTVDAVLDACEPVGDRWLPAARDGLADRALATAAAAVLDLGARALPGMGLGHDLTEAILAGLDRLPQRSTS